MGKLNLYKRNSTWLMSDLELGYKFKYYPEILLSLSRSAVLNKKYVNYLGNSFHYDNKFTPLILQNYPFEISNKILNHMDEKPKTVLDIGGNIGQFICTLNYFLRGDLTADIFEPNEHIFKMLYDNTKHIKNACLYNYGVGKPGKHKFFFEPGRSAIGSLVKQNAGERRRLKSGLIETINDVFKKTKRSRYDLVKIDVEGYEYDVIKNIKSVAPKYLFLEASSVERTKPYNHSGLLKIIESKFGPYDILYISELSKGSVMFDMLLKFKPTK